MINTIGRMELDELFASGKAPVFTKAIELAAGSGSLKRGQLIGVSTEGVYSPIKSGDDPYGILCEDIDATDAAGVAVYVSGHFNANKVVGYVEADHYNALRGLGIYVDEAIAY